MQPALPKPGLPSDLGRDPKLPPSMMYYALEGMAGKMALPDGRFIFKRNFAENVLSRTRNKEAIARNNKYFTITRNYYLLTHGSTLYWVPAGVGDMPRNKLVCLQKQAKVEANWLYPILNQLNPYQTSETKVKKISLSLLKLLPIFS